MLLGSLVLRWVARIVRSTGDVVMNSSFVSSSSTMLARTKRRDGRTLFAPFGDSFDLLELLRGREEKNRHIHACSLWTKEGTRSINVIQDGDKRDWIGCT